MDPMSGCDIRLVFTLPPRDSKLYCTVFENENKTKNGRLTKQSSPKSLVNKKVVELRRHS